MMEASQHGTDAGRDTTMCGDPKAFGEEIILVDIVGGRKGSYGS